MNPVAVTTERREEPRTPHRALVIMAYGPGEKLVFEHAELVDCSPHGIAISFHRALPINGQFLVKLKLNRVYLVAYVVRNCRPEGKTFRIGAQFVRQFGNGSAQDPEPDTIHQALLAS